MPKTELPTITILGCGYVGVTTAAVLANCGFRVYAVEVNPERFGVLKKGRSFFYEAGIDNLLAAGIKAKTLTITKSYDKAVPASDIIFSCVGTPDNPDGSSNLTYVFDAAAEALGLMKNRAIFVQKSTVPVGTGTKIMKQFAERSKKTIRYVSNPEFLREGTAVGDTLWFDRIVAGSNNSAAARTVLDVYRVVEERRNEVAEIAELAPPKSATSPSYMATSLHSAELIKVTSNAFLALKISFANSIAKLADQTQADINEVMAGVGADPRIGVAFLNAGRGYGGGCFPKDVSGLIRRAEELGVSMEIMNAAANLNESMPHYVIRKVAAVLGDQGSDNAFEGKKVAVLGLSFKAGTSDCRRSPAIAIANTLAEQKAQVRAYDPEAVKEAKPWLNDMITLANSLDAAVRGTDLIFVATDWPEFVSMDLAKIAKLSGAKLLIDCMNRLDTSRFADLPLKHVGVGRA